jgi:hypothetical protein
MWSAEHSIETSASAEITGDFPDVLKALAERAER